MGATAFAETVRQVRGHLGLTQTQLASRLGVSQVAVQKWEAGTRQPRPQVKKQILDLAPDALRKRLGLAPLGKPEVHEPRWQELADRLSRLEARVADLETGAKKRAG